MAHPFYENGRIQAGLTPDQFHAEMSKQAEASDTGLDPEAVEKLEFTRLNLRRTERIMRTYKVADDLAEMLRAIDSPQTWMVLTEPWCGDSAQCLPYITAMASLSLNIDLRLILRDENLDLMDNFLTNGSRSIPHLVIFDHDGNELANWGPRPADAQVVFNDAKSAGLEKPGILEKLHLFYGRNRGAALEDEFRFLLKDLLNNTRNRVDEK